MAAHRIQSSTRVICGLAILTWVFLPVSVVLTIWSGDWRWSLTGLIAAVAGTAFAAVVIEGEKKLAKSRRPSSNDT